MLLAAVVLAIAAQQPAPPDRILLHARIWTGVTERPYAEAMALRGDRIVAIGTSAEIERQKGPKTLVTDLGGRLVVPGFNDAHWHLTTTDRAELADAGSLTEIATRLRTWAAARPTGWLLGRGWAYDDFPNRLPHRRQLDQLFPDRPVALWERDGHMVLVNSKVLEMAHLDRTTPDPPNGRIERDASGELTGEFKEAAMELVTRLIPPPTPDDVYRSLQSISTAAASYGLTSVQVVNAGLTPDEMSAVLRATREGSLRLRLYVAVPFDAKVSDRTLAEYVALQKKYAGPLLKFGSAKGVLDGTVDAKTAAMLEPYTGAGNETGIPMWKPDVLNRTVARYDSVGLQVLLHAIGDRAIRMALDAFEAAARTNHTTGRRHRVEHMEVPSPVDLPRFKALGVIASTQAMFAYPDATTLGNYAGLLGPVRAERANAFKRVDDAGSVQAFGSDYPVFTMEVMRGINTAVNRTTVDGTPAGGWFPENRIGIDAALRHFTRDAAYASFDEKDKGTLAPGMLADFVVLSRDLLAAPPSEIPKTRVLLTVMGGRETWRAPADGWAAR